VSRETLDRRLDGVNPRYGSCHEHRGGSTIGVVVGRPYDGGLPAR
jgi:hypothetical protein